MKNCGKYGCAGKGTREKIFMNKPTATVAAANRMKGARVDLSRATSNARLGLAQHPYRLTRGNNPTPHATGKFFGPMNMQSSGRVYAAGGAKINGMPSMGGKGGMMPPMGGKGGGGKGGMGPIPPFGGKGGGGKGGMPPIPPFGGKGRGGKGRDPRGLMSEPFLESDSESDAASDASIRLPRNPSAAAMQGPDPSAIDDGFFAPGFKPTDNPRPANVLGNNMYADPTDGDQNMGPRSRSGSFDVSGEGAGLSHSDQYGTDVTDEQAAILERMDYNLVSEMLAEGKTVEEIIAFYKKTMDKMSDPLQDPPKDEMPEHEKRFFKALNRLKSRTNDRRANRLKRQKGNGNGRYKTPKPQNIIMSSSQLGSGGRMSRSAEGRLIDPDTERQMRARAAARARFATSNGANGGFSELGKYLFGNGN